MLEMLSFTLSIPGKILIVFKISGATKPGRIPNFSVLKTILPSAFFCRPEVKSFGIIISDKSSTFSVKNIEEQTEFINNSLALICFALKPT